MPKKTVAQKAAKRLDTALSKFDQNMGEGNYGEENEPAPRKLIMDLERLLLLARTSRSERA